MKHTHYLFIRLSKDEITAAKQIDFLERLTCWTGFSHAKNSLMIFTNKIDKMLKHIKRCEYKIKIKQIEEV